MNLIEINSFKVACDVVKLTEIKSAKRVQLQQGVLGNH